MDELFKEITCCRVCKSERLWDFWSLGEMYIVDFPKTYEEARNAAKAPVTLCKCEDCHLVQLRHSVNPKKLYLEFFYRSGINEMMSVALHDVVIGAQLRTAVLNKGDAVLDIGCNDGTLLRCYHDFITRVGIDPARNIRKPGAQLDGWHFVNDFFSPMAFAGAQKFKIVSAIAMFYDLQDPVQFCRDVKAVLHQDGIFVVQMNYLKSMLDSDGCDNVEHEHLTYFSLTTLMNVFNRAGLQIFDVELNAVNGGSMRVYACHQEAGREIQKSVTQLLVEECGARLDQKETYNWFVGRVGKNLAKINAWIDDLVANEQEVYCYGASTRGTTLTQLLDLGGAISGAAERDPNKVGRYMVGADPIQIVSEESARLYADYFLVLPWHFFPAIKKREEQWMLDGGKFIVPLPIPKIVSISDEGNGVKRETVDMVGWL